MATFNTSRLLDRCIRRPDGLILSRDHTFLPDRDHVLRTLVKHRRIMRLGRGAYVETEKYRALADWQRFELAARAVGAVQGRVLAGYSAAAVHGLWRYISVPASHLIYRQSNGARIKTGPTLMELHTKLPDRDCVDLADLRVTGIDRTIVDLTRVHGFGAGFVAACSALRSDATTVDSLRKCAAGMQGVGHLPLILEHATGVVESALEAVFLAQVVFFGDFEVIPQPVVVAVAGGRRYRVDFQVKGSDQFVELDGGEKYGPSEKEQKFVLWKEKQRADELARAGVQPHRFRYQQVMSLEAYRGMLAVLGLLARPQLPPIHLG